MCRDPRKVGWVWMARGGYVPVHPECLMRLWMHRPEPKELARYTHSWEGMPQMTWWDKWWSGIR